MIILIIHTKFFIPKVINTLIRLTIYWSEKLVLLEWPYLTMNPKIISLISDSNNIPHVVMWPLIYSIAHKQVIHVHFNLETHFTSSVIIECHLSVVAHFVWIYQTVISPNLPVNYIITWLLVGFCYLSWK